MSVPQQTADSSCPHGHGRALAVLLFAACVLAWLLLAPLQAAGNAAPHGFAAGSGLAAPGDDGPPEGLHPHVVRKKHRRTELVPVTAASAPLVAQLPPAGDWIGFASAGVADADTENHPALAGIDRGPALPIAPQLRLRPSQAPPAG